MNLHTLYPTYCSFSENSKLIQSEYSSGKILECYRFVPGTLYFKEWHHDSYNKIKMISICRKMQKKKVNTNQNKIESMSFLKGDFHLEKISICIKWRVTLTLLTLNICTGSACPRLFVLSQEIFIRECLGVVTLQKRLQRCLKENSFVFVALSFFFFCVRLKEDSFLLIFDLV